MEMSRLTRDGTAEPVSRDQILRPEGGQGRIYFPVQLTMSRFGNLTRLILIFAIYDDHTYILSCIIYLIVLFVSPQIGNPNTMYCIYNYNFVVYNLRLPLSQYLFSTVENIHPYATLLLLSLMY